MTREEALESIKKYGTIKPAKTPREQAYKTVEWALMVLRLEHKDLADDARIALEVLK